MFELKLLDVFSAFRKLAFLIKTVRDTVMSRPKEATVKNLRPLLNQKTEVERIEKQKKQWETFDVKGERWK